MTPIIAVDIGNSAIKIGVEKEGSILACHRIETVAEINEGLFPDKTCFWSVCSVNGRQCEKLLNWQKSHRPQDKFHLISADQIPIPSNVDHREQVGRDRLVAAWQANSVRPKNEDLVVVDAGTAVTIDRIDSQGVFQGGVIFLGGRRTLTSLAAAAHDLPDYSKTDYSNMRLDLARVHDSPIGKNTRDAILSGVFHSQLFAIFEIAKLMSLDHNVVGTGGQLSLLSKFLPGSWSIQEHLVLQGTKEIGELILEHA